MAKVQKDFEDLLKLFNRHKVRYCIIGAYAIAFHAVPRYTKDLDLFLESKRENGERILKALKDFGFTRLNVTAEEFDKPGLIVQLGYEPVRIDLITSIDGRSFEQVWKNKKSGRFGSAKVYFIGLTDLIKNKKASARKQDLADLEILENIKRRT